jgi:hypothetical protein
VELGSKQLLLVYHEFIISPYGEVLEKQLDRPLVSQAHHHIQK